MVCTQASAIGDNTAVKVTLNDCLACAGCVTSAETVLMEQQGAEQFLAALEAARGAAAAGTVSQVAVSLSPQSVASLAAAAGVSAEAARRRLAAALRRLFGAAAVFDIAEARAVALAEAAWECVDRYSQRTAAASVGSNGGAAATPAPLLASACPGWVCYAEKAAPQALPHMATTRSPQAVAGALLKRAWPRMAARVAAAPAAAADGASGVFHVCVMPCADKKLEASRDELRLPSGEAEVDLVLTTIELGDILKGRGVDLADSSAPMDALDSLTELMTPAGDGGTSAADGMDIDGDECAEATSGPRGGSGGWADTVARRAYGQLFGVPAPRGALAWAQARRRGGADYQTAELLPPPGVSAPPLRVATVYGFKAIQSLLRRIKTGQCEHDYVEVMACPGGCLNGGGQLRPADSTTAPRELLGTVEGVYHKGMPDEGAWEAPEDRFGLDAAALRTTFRRRERPAATQVTNW